ncbi:uncharacterized protein MKK02DRAFT_29777 [Dioszegia hungarica]|uniref:Uncharacterized protein n=1 Tax=Dioszegia hungarica TaxID=4972 RepID=A0AA38HGM9_9TREE|nr:uncharacterized protein MKK02DRAFT_29777 [Dioszegia hungarica]KAI9639798.1 hypothetical protein MKK02DRAFT_29777 [Dioszegia hungarica]
MSSPEASEETIQAYIRSLERVAGSSAAPSCFATFKAKPDMAPTPPPAATRRPRAYRGGRWTPRAITSQDPPEPTGVDQNRGRGGQDREQPHRAEVAVVFHRSEDHAEYRVPHIDTQFPSGAIKREQADSEDDQMEEDEEDGEEEEDGDFPDAVKSEAPTPQPVSPYHPSNESDGEASSLPKTDPSLSVFAETLSEEDEMRSYDQGMTHFWTIYAALKENIDETKTKFVKMVVDTAEEGMDTDGLADQTLYVRRSNIRKAARQHITRILEHSGKGHLEGENKSPWRPRIRIDDTRRWIESSILGNHTACLERYEQLKAVFGQVEAVDELIKEAWAEVESEASLARNGSDKVKIATFRGRHRTFRLAAFQHLSHTLGSIDDGQGESISNATGADGAQRQTRRKMNPHRTQQNGKRWQTMWQASRAPDVTEERVRWEIDCIEQLSEVLTAKVAPQLSTRSNWRDRIRGQLKLMKDGKPDMTVAEAVSDLSSVGPRFSKPRKR